MVANIERYCRTLHELLLSTEVTDRDGAILPLDEGAETAVQIIRSLESSSGKAMIIGNGGSAAISSHMQNDLCKAVGVRALVLPSSPC